MPYPTEILLALSTKYQLHPLLQERLQASLLSKIVRTAVESHTFDPELLLISLPPLHPHFSPYIAVISPEVAEKIVEKPSLHNELMQSALKNLNAFKEWEAIKLKVEELNKLPGNFHKKKREGRELSYRMQSLHSFFISSHSIIMWDHFPVFASICKYAYAQQEYIDTFIENQFRKLFSQKGCVISGITFNDKSAGIQSGTQIEINYQDPAIGMQPLKIRYYVKTHQHGATSQMNSAKPVDLKELFVYKLLEYMGYGPKIHFFFDPLSDSSFFIATQDIAFTKVPFKTKTFTRFDAISAECNAPSEILQASFLKKYLVCLDVLSRILYLHDTTTNPNNFGFVTANQLNNKMKCYDFRMPDRHLQSYCMPDAIKNFQQGNGAFNYVSSKFLKDVFRNPLQQKERFYFAYEFMLELQTGRPCQSRAGYKMPLISAIQRVEAEIKQYAQEQQFLNQNYLPQALQDLSQYCRDIIITFEVLRAAIERVHLASSHLMDLTIFKKSPAQQLEEDKILSIIGTYALE